MAKPPKTDETYGEKSSRADEQGAQGALETKPMPHKSQAKRKRETLDYDNISAPLKKVIEALQERFPPSNKPDRR